MIRFYKKPGETPLEALGRLKRERLELADEKMTYAGRLDPLAEGELLVLIGEECKQKDDYLGLDKEYIVDVLFGVSTDTGDVLGVIKEVGEAPAISQSEIAGAVSGLVGKFSQTYPAFSSRTILGKPLFWLSRNKKIAEEEIPKKDVEIYSVELLEVYEMNRADLEQKIYQKIGSVAGDFRQAEITGRWQEFFQNSNPEKFTLAKIKISCSSGTYMRVLAENLGQKLETKALAFHINRTKIGK